MQIDGDEEHRRAVGVHIADQPAAVDVAHDPLDRGEGQVDVRRIVHGQNNAGDDLRHQAQGQDAAKGPPVVQVSGCRQRHVVCAEADDRQPGVQPLLDARLRDVGGFVFAHFLPLALTRS